MAKNDDYKRGISFLLKKCKMRGINIRKYEWVVPLSNSLSEHGVCYRFWRNAHIQNSLSEKNLSRIKAIKDLFHNNNTTMFLWDHTNEGFEFWRDIEEEIFKDNDNDIKPLFNTTPIRKFYGVKEIQWFKRQQQVCDLWPTN